MRRKEQAAEEAQLGEGVQEGVVGHLADFLGIEVAADAEKRGFAELLDPLRQS